MDHNPGRAGADAQFLEPTQHSHSCTWRTLQDHSLIRNLAADGAYQVELPADFVTQETIGLQIGLPVSQELIGILPAMSQSQRNLGEHAEHGRGQRVLTVDRENDGCVKPSIVQATDQGMIALTVEPWRGGLHPGGIVDDHIVNHGDQRGGLLACR